MRGSPGGSESVRSEAPWTSAYCGTRVIRIMENDSGTCGSRLMRAQGGQYICPYCGILDAAEVSDESSLPVQTLRGPRGKDLDG